MAITEFPNSHCAHNHPTITALVRISLLVAQNLMASPLLRLRQNLSTSSVFILSRDSPRCRLKALATLFASSSLRKCRLDRQDDEVVHRIQIQSDLKAIFAMRIIRFHIDKAIDHFLSQKCLETVVPCDSYRSLCSNWQNQIQIRRTWNHQFIFP